MTEGVQVRELPDGGREFLLEDPRLCAVVVGGGVTLRFGPTDVRVTGPCTLEIDGTCHRLDPARPESVAPLLSCLPGAARWLWASPEGRLTVLLMQGQRLVVPGPPGPGTWSVGRLADVGRLTAPWQPSGPRSRVPGR